MSYMVLARKWRPQQFDDLIGQEHVSQTLKNAITADRVHHAFLFTGARGVGKTSAARIFAKALNCAEGPTLTPCGVCPSCVEITASRGIDVFEIDGASNTGVDDIRELRENIRYLPSTSRYKIFIIDEVHMLSINAFNALLKTLEEPPDHAKFIFATTEPHKIPVTILSRCQRFDFRKIALGKVAARLKTIAAAEGIKVSDAGLTMIARAGGGSMRDSQSTFDQVIAYCGEQVDDVQLQGLLGMVDQRLLINLLEAIFEGDAGRGLGILQQVDEQGHSFRQFCQQLIELVRALLFISVVEDPSEMLEVSESELQELRKLAVSADLNRLQRTLTLLMQTETQLAHANYPRLCVEMAVVKLASLPNGADVAHLIHKLDLLEKRLPVGGVVPSRPARTETSSNIPPPPPQPFRSSPPAEEPESPAESRVQEPVPVPATAPAAPRQQDWAGLVEFVNQKRRALGSVLEHAHPLTSELPLLKFGYPEGSFNLQLLGDSETRSALEALAAEFFGRPVRLEVVKMDGEQQPATPTFAQQQKEEQVSRQQQLRDNANEHPMVKAAKNIFDGEVEDVRPIDKGFI
ncbi:DNA polymerase III subunit gamma/tau [Geopsychrobacter electrodiphilus]|uniref:DNA polymerase III subunit gamma/tau n=1 Tax=Geopsychrobacter electrodiphilus TaxID=225196 RepID=UPI000373CCD5|nr:DNA polymerase III subunit gamma/tau [Geopsychrobacter electrodiphilus]